MLPLNHPENTGGAGSNLTTPEDDGQVGGEGTICDVEDHGLDVHGFSIWGALLLHLDIQNLHPKITGR